ncbi:hypothetical protein N9C70_02400 [Flavobacteriales bacterium]|nr:hypothetical protein [Flavobacteriales bacterium]
MRNLLALLLLAPCALFAQVPDYVPIDGLVAYWPLDGHAMNAHGTNYDGNIAGASPTNDRHGAEASAFAFDGVDDRITIPNDFDFTALTVSVWFYRTSQPETYQAIVDRSLTNNIGWWIEESQVASESLLFKGGVASGNYFTASASLPGFGNWTHVCAIYEAGQQELFVNGVLTSTDDNEFPLQFPDANLYIGSRTSAAWFHGAIDDVGIWNRALNEAEVEALFLGAPIEYGCTDSLACNFDEEANEDDGSCIVDFSISNLNGTNDLQVCPGEEVTLNLQSAATTGAVGCAVNPFIIFDESIYKQDTIFSIAARFTLNQSDLLQMIYRQISDGEMGLSYSPTSGLSFSTKASYGNCYTASGWVGVSTPIEEGIQYSVVATYQRGESIRLFVDGELKATSSVNDGLLADCNIYSAEIGQDSDNALTIDEIGFYNSMLNDSSISDYTGCVIQSNLFGDALTLLEFNSNEIETSGTSDITIASATIDSIESSCSCGHPAFNQALWSTGLSSSSLTWSAATDSAIISVILPDYPSCTDTIAFTLHDTTACSDPLACNFDSSAFCSLNCTYPPFGLDNCFTGGSLCGENTIWNSTLQECVGVIQTPDSIVVPIPSCGPGTVWDPVAEECIVAIPADINFDGCVTVGDLLELLAVHGTCPPYPEWPEEPTDTTWACGDPVTYWDYDYATALIGDQCWLAENLRTALYANGDSISANLTDGEWTSTTTGATTVYGEGNSDCSNYSLDIDACNEAQSLAEYGRLFNWYAVDDVRSLCPTGWHVPTDGEWIILEMELGMTASEANSMGYGGTDEGTQLKDTSGWSNNGNGTDDIGFSAIPGGTREGYSGNFWGAGLDSYWWSASLDGSHARYRYLYSGPDVYRGGDDPHYGLYVRCIKD